MDADIAAADALQLERIAAQDYRNEAADLAAHRAAVRAHYAELRAQYTGFLDWIKAEYAKLPPDATLMRQAMALELADKYFTTGTATLQESIDLDATNDAKRFKAALEKALASV